MVSEEFEIKALERAELERQGKEIPFELMNEHEQDLALEKRLKERK